MCVYTVVDGFGFAERALLLCQHSTPYQHSLSLPHCQHSVQRHTIVCCQISYFNNPLHSLPALEIHTEPVLWQFSGFQW